MYEAAEAVDVETVEIPQHRPIAVAHAQPPRDNVSMLLPPVPAKGRQFGHLADQAKRIGERLGAIVTGDGSSKALYSFPAGGSRIEGPTVWLIGALWQEYGHVVVDSEVREERGGRVAITTTIVDRINGTAYRREHHTALSPAPAKFARKADQAERWATMQLQSAISKAERTTVQHFLPGWYVDIAVESAREAFGKNVLGKNDDGSPRTLTQAIAEAVGAFERNLKVSQAQLEGLLEAERPLWTLSDFAEVRAVYRRIKNGEATVAGIFGEPSASSAASAAKSEPQGLDGLASDGAAAKTAPAEAAAPPPAKKAAAKKAPTAAAPTPPAAAAASVEPEPAPNSPADAGYAPPVAAAAPPPPPMSIAAPPPPRSSQS